jgi:hypothetical protein
MDNTDAVAICAFVVAAVAIIAWALGYAYGYEEGRLGYPNAASPQLQRWTRDTVEKDKSQWENDGRSVTQR